MSRATRGVVLTTILVLVGLSLTAAHLPNVRPSDLIALAADLRSRLPRPPAPFLPAVDLMSAPAAAAGAAAAVLAWLSGLAFAGALMRRRADPLRSVIRQTRRGRAVARVACHLRLPQDAVRTLLHPGRVRRRRPRRRREGPSAAARPAPARMSAPEPAARRMRRAASG